MNNIKAMKLEEDMFPKAFTNFIEKDFGILFYNEQNKQSYDSNHALIYKDKIKDLEQVLDFITLSPKIIETKDLQENFFPMLRIFVERTI